MHFSTKTNFKQFKVTFRFIGSKTAQICILSGFWINLL